ncbi:MAG TPA: transcriptional repressor [Sandaracinaceae bacterium LLY-WYZ-13_1]|nr:transcriptional repressor [Sandaracinaceae bacterium LLY-WYZ-13_1]
MDDDEGRLRELLVTRGLRVTRQRLALLAEMTRRRGPLSHAQLTARLSQLNRATVYRNLQVLTDRGVLVRAQMPDRVWRYQLPGRDADSHRRHPHFVCEACGHVHCLPPGEVVLRRRTIGGEVASIQVRGTCDRCLGDAG